MATVLTPAEIRNQEDHISDNAVPNVIATNAACLSLAAIAVALRFICRRLKRIKYEADDWLILAGLVRPPCSRSREATGQPLTHGVIRS